MFHQLTPRPAPCQPLTLMILADGREVPLSPDRGSLGPAERTEEMSRACHEFSPGFPGEVAGMVIETSRAIADVPEYRVSEITAGELGPGLPGKARANQRAAQPPGSGPAPRAGAGQPRARDEVRVPFKVSDGGASVTDSRELIDAEYAAADTATTAPTIRQMWRMARDIEIRVYEWRENPARQRREEGKSLWVPAVARRAESAGRAVRRQARPLPDAGVRPGKLPGSAALVADRPGCGQTHPGPGGRDFTAAKPAREWSAT